MELRKDTCRSAPTGTRINDDHDVSVALNVISLRTPGRAKTAPTIHGIKQPTGLFLSNSMIFINTCCAMHKKHKKGPTSPEAGLGGSVGCAILLETRRSQVQPPLRWATFFRGD